MQAHTSLELEPQSARCISNVHYLLYRTCSLTPQQLLGSPKPPSTLTMYILPGISPHSSSFGLYLSLSHLCTSHYHTLSRLLLFSFLFPLIQPPSRVIYIPRHEYTQVSEFMCNVPRLYQIAKQWKRCIQRGTWISQELRFHGARIERIVEWISLGLS